MKRICTFALAAAGLLVAGGAVAQQRPDALERQLERIEQALARIEARTSGREGGGMMENCQEMMKGGGMMGGGRPNEQWRKPDTRK